MNTLIVMPKIIRNESGKRWSGSSLSKLHTERHCRNSCFYSIWPCRCYSRNIKLFLTYEIYFILYCSLKSRYKSGIDLRADFKRCIRFYRNQAQIYTLFTTDAETIAMNLESCMKGQRDVNLFFLKVRILPLVFRKNTALSFQEARPYCLLIGTKFKMRGCKKLHKFREKPLNFCYRVREYPNYYARISCKYRDWFR